MINEASHHRRKVYLLAVCQALFLTAAVLSVTMAGVVGAALAPRPWMATLPYGVQFAAIVVFAYPAARLVAFIGRRWSFALGALAATASGLAGYLAVIAGSFAGLMLAHLLLGIFVAHANFYRFAATDGVEGALKARAVALVTAGGVFAGLVAPPLANLMRGMDDSLAGFAPTYGLFSLIGLLTLVTVMLLPRTAARATHPVAAVAASPSGWLSHPRGFAVAVYCAGVGYLAMNLLMIQSTLALASAGVAFPVIATAIQVHVLCMFLPSFVTGRIIAAVGHRSVLLAGFGLLAACGAVGSLGAQPSTVIPALALLGVAWNLLFVGGTAFLTECYEDRERFRAQGLNDTAVSVLSAVGAFSAGALFETLGWSGSNLLTFPIALIGLVLVAAVVRSRASAAGGAPGLSDAGDVAR